MDYLEKKKMKLGIKIIFIGIIMLTISIVVSILTVQITSSELLSPKDLPEDMVPIPPTVTKFNLLFTYFVIASFAIIVSGIIIWKKRK